MNVNGQFVSACLQLCKVGEKRKMAVWKHLETMSYLNGKRMEKKFLLNRSILKLEVDFFVNMCRFHIACEPYIL